jgi:hypothetical protein
MKILSICVAVLGVVALVIAVIGALANTTVLNVTRAGYLRGATALFLLALVIIVYDKCYCCKK